MGEKDIIMNEAPEGSAGCSEENPVTRMQGARVVVLILSLTEKNPFPSLGLSFPSVDKGA